MKHGVLAHGDPEHLEHRVVADRHVVAHELPEGSFRAALVRKEAALDHDLGGGGHHQVDVLAGPHLHRRAGEVRRDLELVGLVGHRRRSGEKDLRLRPDEHRRLQGASHALRLLVVHRQVVGGGEAAAKLFVAHEHGAVKGEVRHAGLGLFGEEEGGSEVGAAVALGIGEERQVGHLRIAEVVGHRYAALRRTLEPAEVRELVPLAAEVTGSDAENVGEAFPAAVGVREHRQLGAFDVGEEDGPVGGALHLLGDRGELVPGRYRPVGDEQLSALSQAFQVVPHALSSGGRLPRGQTFAPL